MAGSARKRKSDKPKIEEVDEVEEVDLVPEGEKDEEEEREVVNVLILGLRKAGKKTLAAALGTPQQTTSNSDPDAPTTYTRPYTTSGTPITLSTTILPPNNDLSPTHDPPPSILLLTFAIDDTPALSTLKPLYSSLRKTHPDTPVLLAGLKSDLRDNRARNKQLASQGREFVSADAARRVAERWGVRYLEVSAVKGDGVGELLGYAAEEGLERVLRPRDGARRKWVRQVIILCFLFFCHFLLRFFRNVED